MTRARLLLALAVAAALGVILAVVLGGDERASGPPAAAAKARAAATPGKVAALDEQPSFDSLAAPVLQYDDDPAGDERLEGQVVDAEERPVGGAIVVIDASPPREVVTEADGAFVFDRLVARTYTIAARADDRVAGPASVTVTPAGEPVVLRLRGASRLVVDVRRADDGQPVAGALVELRGLAARVATAGDDGRATLTGVGGGWHVVRVSAPGFATELEELAVPGGADQQATVTVRLRPGVSVGGVVVDESGAPVEGARVISENATRQSNLADPRLDGAITDAKGRWRLTGLARETTRFHAYHAAYAPAVTAPLLLGDGVDRDQVELVVTRGARLVGQVVRDGAPVPGAEVRVAIADSRTPQLRRARCDAAGRFELRGLPRRAVHVMAATAGAVSEVVSLDLQRGEPEALVLSLDLAGSIAGVVVTSSGEPVGEARVVAEPVHGTDPSERVTARLRGRPSTVADGDGGFRLDGLEPGAYHVRAIRPGDAPDLVDMRAGVRVDTGDRDARIVVDDLTVLVGRVAFADGEAPASFQVALGFAPPRTFAGTDGTFRIEGVPSGKQYVRVDGPEIVSAGHADVEIAAGEVHDLGTISVERGRTVRGAVVDPAGAPVAGAVVVLGREIKGDGATLMRADEPPLRQAVTGADGAFTLRGIGRGTHVLAADHDTIGRSATVDLGAGAGDVELALTLRPTGAVQGFVRKAGAPVVAFIQLRPIDAVNANWTIATGPDGSYRFDRVAPGTYLLWAGFERGSAAGGSEGVGKRIVVASGQTLERDFDVAPGELVVTLRIESDTVQFGYGLIARDTTATGLALPRNIDEARRQIALVEDVDVKEGMIAAGRQIRFDAVRPGRYVACIAPLRGDPADPSVVAEMQQRLVDWPVSCIPVELAASPREHEIRVPTQAPPPPR